MPPMSLPFFALERIRAPQLAAAAAPGGNKTAFNNNTPPKVKANANPTAALPRPGPAQVPPLPTRPVPAQPISAPVTAISASSSTIMYLQNLISAVRTHNNAGEPEFMWNGSFLYNINTQMLAQAQVPLGAAATSASRPPPLGAGPSVRTVANVPIIDLTGDGDVMNQDNPPGAFPATDAAAAPNPVGDLVDQLQRKLEKMHEEMNFWCSRMSQLLTNAPNLIQEAGQKQGRDDDNAIAVAEAFTVYGGMVLSDSVEACKAVEKSLEEVITSWPLGQDERPAMMRARFSS
ncbi:hypothetical protein BGW39_009604 [Mortierella sp. 14UC]|nr:hypothetical protein BGW39_009604 [Mortierella sp. 14UC]